MDAFGFSVKHTIIFEAELLADCGLHTLEKLCEQVPSVLVEDPR